jgi:hypothetical protein
MIDREKLKLRVQEEKLDRMKDIRAHLKARTKSVDTIPSKTQINYALDLGRKFEGVYQNIRDAYELGLLTFNDLSVIISKMEEEYSKYKANRH